MKQKTILLIIAAILACLVTLSTTAARADTLDARMKARAPAVAALKAQGVVGENHMGYIEFLTAPRQIELVRAENRDRAILYRAIARKRGVSIEVVSRLRARALASEALPGEWVQDTNSTWYQK